MTDADNQKDFYKAKADSVKRQLDAWNANLTAEKIAGMDESDFSVRLEYLETMKTEFNDAQVALEKMDLSELTSNTRADFNDAYIEVKSALSRELVSLQRKSSVLNSTAVRNFTSDTSSNVAVRASRLPQLQLAKFSGSYMDWPHFYAIFTTVIEDDLEMSKVEKFQHLLSCLEGVALETIRSIEPTEDNYTTALNLLRNRFDNKLFHFQAHVKAIFGLDGVEKGSAIGLRTLSDKMNSHLRAINTLADTVQILDGILIHVVAQKLDQRTRERWEESIGPNELPAWKTMASFLEKRCRAMENVENAMVTLTPSNQVGKSSHKSTKNSLITLSSSSTSNTKATCPFCDSGEHYISKCTRFLNLSPNLRYKEAKKMHLCLNCLRKGHTLQQCRSGSCRQCQSRHHTLLHISTNSAPSSSLADSSQASSSLISRSVSCPPHQASNDMPDDYVLLATAIVLVQNRFGEHIQCRAILDSASQLNFITTRFANQLQLKTRRSHVAISGIGESALDSDKAVDIVVKSQNAGYGASFVAVVTRTITDYQPQHDFNKSAFQIPANVILADPNFHKSQRIDLLIGAGLFFDLICTGQIRISDSKLILQETKLGWTVSGGISHSNIKRSSLVSLTKAPTQQIQDSSLEDLVKRFWEIENYASSASSSEEDSFCEDFFKQNHTRLENGQYSVKLPFKTDVSMLGNSYHRALRRFRGLETKLAKDPKIKSQYAAFIQEYLSLGHMSLVSNKCKAPKFYLPHHCVQKLDSTTTKLRVVFDGSAKSTSGYSLNDLLLAGPTIQATIFTTLLRFRFFKIALCGDICKMYRCVKVSHPDEYLQIILWRDSPEDDIKAYKLDTLTYGTKSAAFLAIRTMRQLALDEEETFPIGSRIVQRDFYVDDLISGGDSIEEVVEIKRQVKGLLSRGQFPIRKWCSNESAVLDGELEVDKEKLLTFDDQTGIAKALGLVWNLSSDNFLFNFSKILPDGPATKRAVLSTVARTYDPLGLIAPIITKAKIFIQTLWKHQLNWDDAMPTELQSAWSQLFSQLSIVSSLKFPRYAMIPSASFQIHAFCDASSLAYGACIYLRSESQDSISSHLLCSKSRVAPLKTLTIPKLELSAALVLAELVANLARIVPFQCEYHCWSDSTIALSWIRSSPSEFNVFVSNRVSKIQELTQGMTWHHVPTACNPSDILSRGCTPKELMNDKLWQHGPQFLSEPKSNWPTNVLPDIDLPERRRKVLITTTKYDLTRFCKYQNSFTSLQRTFAYVRKFWLTLSKKCTPTTLNLTVEDLRMGTYLFVKNIQEVSFAIDYAMLSSKKSLPVKSNLLSLYPFIDGNGLIRVGGRLHNSQLDYDARHPILLPKGHPVTNAIIVHYHQKLLHAGPRSLLATIRQAYWPIGGIKTVASVINKCLRCFRLKPRYAEHIMGRLPADRVRPNPAFHTTGIDYCGPFLYKPETRNKAPEKCYISIFICFSTKATHLEVVKDLTTASFIAALRRFISIRGKPRIIWTDNGTNFVGAKNELAELRELFLSDPHNSAVSEVCLANGIDWNFIPPRSPHFGGLWEAAVKSAKYHFFRAAGSSVLTLEELRTLVYEISAILNSRPLYAISESPDDSSFLTPAHFLIGSTFTAIDEPDITHLKEGRLNRWQRVCQMRQIFWRKWSTEYLTILQERSKWKTSRTALKAGSLVLLKDENLPALKWRLGKVESTIPGDDGVPRVAMVKTSVGLIKRAVTKLAVLPLSDHIG